MRTATKKLSVILFMLAGFAPLLFVICFSFKQQLIRHRMHRRLEKQELHTVILPDHEVSWAKKGKEIWLDGKLFDVRSFTHHNGKAIIHGLFDEEETAFEKAMSRAWKKSTTGQNRVLAKIFNSLNNFYCNSLPDFHSLSDPGDHNFSLITTPLPYWVKPILTPPPQV